MAERIADKLVRDLPQPLSGNRIVYDAETKGFGVRVTAAGVKAFVLNYYVHGRERRYTIGRYPDWTVLSARRKASDLRRIIDAGGDPLAEREENRDAPTIVDLFKRYEAEHLPFKAARSAADDRSMWTKIILPFFGHQKVAGINHADCCRLHSETAASRPVRANRVLEVLRTAMNLAVRWGWRADNPTSGVRKSQEERRDRYLNREEVQRLLAALDEHPERSSAIAIRLMLLTGCRRGEALAARWSEFDLAAGVWTKPSAHTKQRKVHRAPLSDRVVLLLRERKALSMSEVVFPGKDGRPLTDVKRTWESVRKKAGLEGVRLHDLRHTYASHLASNGETLHTIGTLLGHTQAQTTARYAHLVDEAARRAANRAAELLDGAPRQDG